MSGGDHDREELELLRAERREQEQRAELAETEVARLVQSNQVLKTQVEALLPASSSDERATWKVWVHAKDPNDAHDTYQNEYGYTDRETCREAAQIAEENFYRVDIIITKEPDVKTGEPGPDSPAGGPS